MKHPPSTATNQRLEILAAWTLGALCVGGLIWVATFFVHKGIDEKGTIIGTAATGLIAIAQLAVSRIGQISQSRAMQKMADALHASAPAPTAQEGNNNSATFEYESFPPDDGRKVE
jgi:hypothetical protein